MDNITQFITKLRDIVVKERLEWVAPNVITEHYGAEIELRWTNGKDTMLFGVDSSAMIAATIIPANNSSYSVQTHEDAFYKKEFLRWYKWLFYDEKSNNTEKYHARMSRHDIIHLKFIKKELINGLGYDGNSSFMPTLEKLIGAEEKELYLSPGEIHSLNTIEDDLRSIGYQTEGTGLELLRKIRDLHGYNS